MAWSDKARAAAQIIRHQRRSAMSKLQSTGIASAEGAATGSYYRLRLAQKIKAGRRSGPNSGATTAALFAARQAVFSTKMRNVERSIARTMSKSKTFGAKAAVEHLKSNDPYIRKLGLKE